LREEPPRKAARRRLGGKEPVRIKPKRPGHRHIETLQVAAVKETSLGMPLRQTEPN
jgi:hypothetical protein